MNCPKCNREFERKSDLSRHMKKCGDLYLHMGYLCFIDQNGKEKFLHREIMEQKLGRPLEPGEQVHHKDEIKLNNDPSNLELTTCSDHSKHHWSDIDKKNERSQKMSEAKVRIIHTKGKGQKLTIQQVKDIRAKIKSGIKMTQISKEYDLNYYTVQDIKYRKIWNHI